jgi:class 3 adenylate cyclase
VVRAYQQTSAAVIDHYEGHIAQYLGDGLLVYFFRRRTRSEKVARQAVQGILQNWAVAPLTGEAIGQAFTTTLPDFEDALQLEAAKAAQVDVIVTRNKRHFRQQEVRVLNPEEIVEQMVSTQKLL